MDLLKAKMYLDKVNRDFTRLSKDPDTILRIDIDILLAHVRDLYDALLTEEIPQTPRHEAPARKQAAHRPAEPPEPSVVMPPAAPAAAAPAEPAPPPEEKPAPAPPPPAPPPPPAAEPIRLAEPIVPPAKPAAPASFPAITPEAEGLFEQKQAKELSEKLADLPIADLKKAIALNDRLLLTRELFGGDNSAFDSTIGVLNGFQSMEQAKAYLLEHCVMRYRWTDKKHVEVAKNFIKLVRRRYNNA